MNDADTLRRIADTMDQEELKRAYIEDLEAEIRGLRRENSYLMWMLSQLGIENQLNRLSVGQTMDIEKALRSIT